MINVLHALRVVLIILYTGILGSVAIAVGLVDRSGEGIIWLARRYFGLILWTCRVRVDVEGLEHVTPGQPYVVMANHQSQFDIISLGRILPMSFRFVAKRELARMPIFGWAMRIGGHIVIDRQDREQAVESLKRGARQIAAGTTVIIFPEGTRSASGALQEFKSGGFHLALQARVPILPVTVSGSNRVMPGRSLRIDSGRILVRFSAPIATEKLRVEDRALLKERVREAILAGFEPLMQQPPASA